MVISYGESLYAVVDNGDGTRNVYCLDDVFSTTVAAATDEEAVDAVADRTLMVGGVKYGIDVTGTYVQITRDGEFFTEADWEGDLEDADALQMILDKLEGDEADAAYEATVADQVEDETAEDAVDPNAAFFADADRTVEVDGTRWRLSDCGITYFATTPGSSAELELEFTDSGACRYATDEEIADMIRYELQYGED